MLFSRHIDDDEGRTHALEQSAVKCMRGILFCYMRQCHKVNSNLLSSLQLIYGNIFIHLRQLLHCFLQNIRSYDATAISCFHHFSTDVHEVGIPLIILPWQAGKEILKQVDV